MRGRRAVVIAVVTLQQEGVRKVATTDDNGVFRLRDIAPGNVKMHVVHPDFADEDATAHVDSTGRADRAFTVPDIDLSEPGEVEGEACRERGDRVSGARVTAGELPSYVPAGKLPRSITLTDGDGHFVLSGVHPGAATISAISSVSGRGSARAEVSSGTRREVYAFSFLPHAADSEPVASGNVAVTLGERGVTPALEVVVVSVAEGSEAEHVGIEAGDVIVAIDGVRPNSMSDARVKLSGQPGSDLVIEVSRAGAASKFRLLREAIRR